MVTIARLAGTTVLTIAAMMLASAAAAPLSSQPIAALPGAAHV